MRSPLLTCFVLSVPLFWPAVAGAQDNTPPPPPPTTEPAPTQPPPATQPPQTDESKGGAINFTSKPSTPVAPPPSEDDEGAITIKTSRNMDMQKFAESSQHELTVAGARTRYAINLFGDVQFGVASKDEGIRKSDPAFAVGIFDMLFTANLEKNFSFTSEFAVGYEPNTSLATLERLQLRWQPSKHFYVDVGRFHTDIGYWNVAYHHGRYLQLTVDRPRIIALHGGLLPVHTTGAQVGASADIGSGKLNFVVSGGNMREPLASSGGHNTHGSALANTNGIHGKVEFANFLHRDLRFGASATCAQIPEEPAFQRPILPDQSMEEKIGGVFIAFPSQPFYFISEGYAIQHSLNGTARQENVGSKWRTLGAFALVGYQFGAVTPYVRGEYINSQVGAYFFDPFYVPDPKSGGPIPVSLEVKEILAGARFDVSDWCSLKAEYQFMTGVGTRIPTGAHPGIHTGIVSWSFGI
jgi:hypothetical protein